MHYRDNSYSVTLSRRRHNLGSSLQILKNLGSGVAYVYRAIFFICVTNAGRTEPLQISGERTLLEAVVLAGADKGVGDSGVWGGVAVY